MFATNWAVYYRRTRSLSYGSGRPDTYSAIDDCQPRLKASDIASCFADEILDLKRVTNVQDIRPADAFASWRNVHSNCVVVLRNELEQRLPHLAESHDNNSLIFFHLFLPFKHWIDSKDR
jgi:hypothetical protein